MDEEYTQSDISKEVERLMDEEGFEFGEAVKEAMAQGYKNGGLMVAIQKFANGGGVGSMMQPKKKSYKDQSLTKAEQKKTKPVNQGGGPNYLGKQEEVTTPKKWLSSPDHVVAELAYITPREQKILLDANIYGSLKGKPNKGPNGIMSLQGDLGGFSSGGGNKGGSGGSGGSGGGNDYKARDYYNMMTGTGTTAKSATGDTYRSKNIAKGAVPEFVNTPSGTKYVGSKFKSYGQPTFFGDLFSGGASGYRGTQGTGTGPFGNRFFAGSPISLRGTRLKNGQILGGEYFSENENVGDIKPSLGERISNMGIVGLIKNLFKKDPKDMTESNKYGLGGSKDYIPAGTLDFDPNAQINNINTTVPDNSLALQSFYDNQKPPANITGLTSDITSNQINEFGDGRIGNINDEFATQNNIDNRLMQEYLTDQASFQQPIAASQINEFATQNNIDNRLMQEYLTDQANYNADPLGNPNFDPRVVSEEMGLVGNQVPQGISFTNAEAIKAMTQPVEAFKNTGPFTASGNTSPPSSPFTNQSYGIMDPYQQNYLGDQGRSITTDMYESPNQASLPGNNMVAEITQKDIDRFKQPMTQMMDYDTYKSINTDSTLTNEEFNQLKAQV